MVETPFCVIAGVGPGVGLAVARRFARAGFRVGMIARRAEALAGYVAEIEREGGRALAMPADLTNFVETRRAMATALELHGPAEAMVFNASLWREAGALEIDPSAFHADLALGVTAAVVATQAVAPGMLERGRGTILFTGGGLALAPAMGAAVPSLVAAKSALRGLAFAMAEELRPKGLTLRTVTIAGSVAPATAFDPDRIADVMFARYSAPAEDTTVETVFDGR